MLTINNYNKNILREASTLRLAPLFKIERKDGTVLTFTGHDREIYYLGHTYIPIGIAVATSRAKRSDLQEQTNEFSGIFDDASITEEDIAAGKYNDATVTEYVVDWRYPFSGPYTVNVSFLRNISKTSQQWEAEAIGVTGKIGGQFGEVYSRVCPHTLGDAECGVSIPEFTLTGVVTAVSSRTEITIVTASMLADDYFKFGQVTWFTGNNKGTSQGVESNTAIPLSAGITLILRTATLKDIEVGNLFTIEAGCDGLAATCNTKFSNLVNNGSFPYIPGNSRYIENPVDRQDP